MLTLTELREALRRGETTSLAATQAALDRIVALDNEIKSYLSVTDELALEQAAEADRRRAAGEETPLL
jgi:aspartyl-tRNA(Asn)/glutamyl-tRNA(Gln) amidotransferase subunit A